MIAEILSLPFVNACIGLDVEGQTAILAREIDGGREKISSPLPIVIGGQKGLVQESELRIPNMRGIMQSRTKPLEVLEAEESNENRTASLSFDKPKEKEDCRILESDNVEELVSLLHNEAKVI